MKTTYQNRRDRKNGVALVIVLGLLSVLTTLAVAFAIAMRVENMAAQNFANSVRAEHVAHAGIAHAMERINFSMITNPVPVTYPRWKDSIGQLVEAVASTNGIARCDDILTGEIEKAIPVYLLTDAQHAVNDTPYCRWENIVDGAGRTNRFAYLAVNMSGLIDANYMGGTNRVWSESLREIDIHKIPGITDTNAFYTSRKVDRRYETLPELLKLNSGLSPDAVQDLFVYSYDPGRDMCFSNRAAKESLLGIATTNDLMLKFNVNVFTNLPPNYQTDPTFQANKAKLIELLKQAGLTYKPEDVVWNIINWIDTDRYPQNDQTGPPAYVSTEGGEALPCINEIVLQKVVTPISTGCQFAVEMWYPFVVENETWGTSSSTMYSLLIDTIPTNGTVNVDIAPMTYGTNTEFLVYTSRVMNVLTADVRAVVFEGAANDPNRRPVDAAMDRDGNCTGPQYVTNWTPVVKYTTFTNFYSMEVDDPRSNGKPAYWVQCTTSNTLGRMNSISYPWGGKAGWPTNYDRQGLPIYIKNGPMENIGEMGYIPLANRENHAEFNGGNGQPARPWKYYWCTFDLMTTNQGAFLLDYMTVYPTNRFGHGLVTINTRDQETLKALFTEMRIGWSNQAHDNYRYLDVEEGPPPGLPNRFSPANLIANVTQTIIDRTMGRQRGAISFADLFEGVDYIDPTLGVTMPGGPVAQAFRDIGTWWAAKTGLKVNDKAYEDAFRDILELISFRQNIFMIAVASQVMAPNGTTVEAEKRGLATVYRDAYTGNYFVRSFKWVK